MNEPAGQIRLTGDQPLRAVLASLGGWPVLDPSWKAPAGGHNASTAPGADAGQQQQQSDYSVESLLGRLRGDLNQGVLVEQWVGPDDKNSSVNIIQVYDCVIVLFTTFFI